MRAYADRVTERIIGGPGSILPGSVAPVRPRRHRPRRRSFVWQNASRHIDTRSDVMAPEPGVRSAGDIRQARHGGGALRFEGVEKRYGDFPALKPLDLEIAPGEFLTLLGPSGSGKTTLLSMIAGFENVSAGAIYLDGRRLDTLPPEKRNVGMVVQNYALFPHMSVRRNVEFPLRMRRVERSEIDASVLRALELVELADQIDKYPSQLSGGQQQRVALARAIVFEPQLLLMDEPLGALDRRLRESVQFELIEMHRKLATTIVYVTHDQVEALTMSDRIVVLRDGEVQQVGTPREIYEVPANRFVANFIGNSISLDGTISESEGQSCRLRTAGGVELEGLRAGVIAAGEAATLVVRPERIDLGPHRAGQGVPARVTDRLFMGELTRYSVELEDGTSLDVNQPNTRDRVEFDPGTRVSLVWNASDAVVVRQ